MAAALRFQATHWQRVVEVSSNPRHGPSADTHVRTHAVWVHKLLPNEVHTRENAPSFLSLCLPRGMLRCLGRYRLGGHHLYGRLHGVQANRQECPLCCCQGGLYATWHNRLLARCGGTRSEDLLHFMLECPAYDHIRDRHAVLFEFPANMSAVACMQKLFGGNKQRRLARCVFEMDVYRRHLLGKACSLGCVPTFRLRTMCLTCLTRVACGRMATWARLMLGMLGSQGRPVQRLWALFRQPLLKHCS